MKFVSFLTTAAVCAIFAIHVQADPVEQPIYIRHFSGLSEVIKGEFELYSYTTENTLSTSLRGIRLLSDALMEPLDFPFGPVRESRDDTGFIYYSRDGQVTQRGGVAPADVFASDFRTSFTSEEHVSPVKIFFQRDSKGALVNIRIDAIHRGRTPTLEDRRGVITVDLGAGMIFLRELHGYMDGPRFVKTEAMGVVAKVGDSS